jgi:cyclopropane-fatty-acyl-phospholipid synthase
MATGNPNLQDKSSQQSLQLVQSLLSGFHPRDFAVELWDGAYWPAEKNQFPRFTWKINNPEALQLAAFSSNREVSLAEAYCYGDFDLEGDIESVFGLADYLMSRTWTRTEKLRLAGMALTLSAKLPRSNRGAVRLEGSLHSKHRDQRAVRYHYDVSNDFYALWLDSQMQYSAGYFENANDDLEIAQVKKLDYLCRSLRLKPEERLLDIGCGWGGLIRHAVRRYGVTALGITLSPEQLKWCEQSIQKEGLGDRCQVRLLDYRNLDAPAAFDKIVSIGMVEHVGAAKLSEYFSQALDLLRPHGMFLVSGIARAANRPVDTKPTFTDLYIFPDGELVTISNLLARAETAGFEVQQVENLREHYRLTVLRWLRKLEDHADAAKKIVSELKYRMWRLYLAGSAYYFQKAKLGLYHSLLLKNADSCGAAPATANASR